MQAHGKKKLNLGCGEDRKEGFLHIDHNPLAHPEVLHDLNVFPYPFEEGELDEVVASHVIEHLDKPFLVMQELHRILKVDGTLEVRVPHFSRGFTHAEHAHGFDITFPLYFNPNFTKSGYYGVHFELQDMKLRWLANAHLLPFAGYGTVTISLLKGISAVISFLANLSPAFMSRIWCFWVGGFDEMRFIFIKK